MPTVTVPNSYGASLREFNPCHAGDGRFCSTGGSLPEQHGSYFKPDAAAHPLPLDRLQTIHFRPGNKAEQYMADALAGTGEKRKPITVQRMSNGRYRVLDGNSTVAVARKHGWRTIPARIVGAARRMREFNHCHAKADGKFCSTDGGGTHGSIKRETPIRVSDIGHAIELILQGKVVELPDAKRFNTVLTKLAAMANDAKAKGQAAPNYDLCKVSVKGTNLFCAGRLRTKEYPNGVPRIQMPQFSGQPVPGSPAAKLTKNQNGNVDAANAFVRYLTTSGIRVESGSVPAARLKASQAELVGANVAGMMTNKAFNPAKEPIFVSRDNYVIDGHHRWAAVVGRDAADNRLGQLKMRVVRVDAPISEVLKLANSWTKRFGIKPKSGS